MKKYRVRIRNTILGLIIIGLLSITVLIIYGYLNSFGSEFFPKERDKLGQFGDYFGGTLNPIFGFASFIALLLTIFYQSKELKLSRTELELSRDELSKSASALALQNKAIELQSFEQTFFSWLSTYRSLLETITEQTNINNIPHDLNGRAALYSFWKNYFNYGYLEALTGIPTDKPEIHKVLNDWDKLYKTHEYQLDGLFRTLYRLILWVHSQPEQKLDRSQKWLYISIIRSQLSWIELAFLFCNGLTERGRKFKTLTEIYAIFDNLTFNHDALTTLKDHLSYPDGYLEIAYSSEAAKADLGLSKSAEV